MTNMEIINNRYMLREQIGKGGMGTVYRALDRLTGNDVALKQVTRLFQADESSTTSIDFRLALAQEFRTLASLRHPNIISVLDYGFDADKKPFFTMDLLENAESILRYGQGKPLDEQIDLIVQMLQALEYLHRRGIIHRDLKPDNVVVVKGKVIVLDFGLAIAREQVVEMDETAGTLAYMAPEVLLGKPAAEVSDLYAVGMMAYELIAGHHAFEMGEIQNLVQHILHAPPDVTRLNVPDSLRVLIATLLSKQPETRYADAAQVIKLLQPDAPETPTIRESFLQAARFVGRDAEMESLMHVLEGAMMGEGAAWLIGGESGVGKSRLLDELRIRAMVSGVLTLRGQAVTEGSVFQMWRDPLRRLCLQTDLSPLDASVLKVIVPDIGTLLDDTVPDAPVIEPEAAKHRLLSTIEIVFRQLTQPMLLILEDLQWATAESLLILRRLCQNIDQLPLLIVANYRDDEHPMLPADLPEMAILRLERLDENAIREVSVSMLGNIGHSDEILDLLNRETEGNVFFLVEVVRALAEESGSLAQVAHAPLPQHVLTGGVRTVIQRRLSSVPPAALPMLQIAAVVGRELDLKLLRAALPDMPLDDMLIHCGSVIDVHDNRWRFAHDKLREAMLEHIAPDDLSTVHQQVARAIETTYPANSDYALALVEHWRKAGSPTKEAYYARLVAEQALRTSEFKRAMKFFERTLALLPPNGDSERLAIFLKLGETYRFLDAFETAMGYLDTAFRLAGQLGDKNAQARALCQQSFIDVLHGKLHQVETNLEHALAFARETNERQTLGQVLFGLGDVFWRLERYYDALPLLKESVTLAREVGDVTLELYALNRISTIHSDLNDYKTAHQLSDEVRQLALRVGNRERAFSASNNLGAIAWYQGQYETARAYYEDALRFSRETGSRVSLILSLGNIGLVDLALDQPERAVPYFVEALQCAVSIDSIIYILFSLIGFCGLEAAHGHNLHGLEMAGMLYHHPQMSSNFKLDLDIVLQKYWSAMPEDERIETMEEGAALQVNDVVRQMLRFYEVLP